MINSLIFLLSLFYTITLFTFTSATDFAAITHYRDPQWDLEELYFPRGIPINTHIEGKVFATDLYLREFVENITITNFTVIEARYPYAGWQNISYDYSNKMFIYENKDKRPVFQFSFDFYYSCIRSGSGKGIFSIGMDEFVLLASYDEFPNKIDVYLTYEMDNLDNATRITSGIYEGDTEVRRLANKALKNFNSTSLTEYMQNHIYEEYYKLFLTNYNFEIRTNMRENNFIVDSIFTKHPSPKYIVSKNKGIVYYSRGSLGNNLTEPQTEWDDFDLNIGDLHYFFHQKLLNEMYLNMTNNNQFNFVVSKLNFPKNASYELDIDALAQVLPNVSRNFSLDQPLVVEIEFSRFVFNTHENGSYVDVDITTNICLELNGTKGPSLLEIYSNARLNVNIEVNVVDNHVFLFNFKVLTIDVLNSFADSGSWGMFLEPKYNNMLENGFKLFINQINSQTNASGKEAFIPIKYIKDRGINAYFPSRKFEHSRIVVKTQNRQNTRRIKFLNYLD